MGKLNEKERKSEKVPKDRHRVNCVRVWVSEFSKYIARKETLPALAEGTGLFVYAATVCVCVWVYGFVWKVYVSALWKKVQLDMPSKARAEFLSSLSSFIFTGTGRPAKWVNNSEWMWKWVVWLRPTVFARWQKEGPNAKWEKREKWVKASAEAVLT